MQNLVSGGHISFLLVFAEGLFSFFSTCVLPLLGFAGGFLSQFFLNRRACACVCVAFAGLLLCSLVEGGRLLLRGDGPWSILWTVLLQSVWGMLPAMAFYFPLRALGRKKPEEL